MKMPVMTERSKQALVKLALEPAWEAVFEPHSYGFRPGRSCHDAIGAIFLAIKSKPKFVFDADVKGAFDNISHNALLGKLHALPKVAHLLKGWRKRGGHGRARFQSNREWNSTGRRDFTLAHECSRAPVRAHKYCRFDATVKGGYSRPHSGVHSRQAHSGWSASRGQRDL